MKPITFLLLMLIMASAPLRGNVLGIHTMIQDNDEIAQQLDDSLELTGRGGWVKQLIYVQDGVEWSWDPKWVNFVNGAQQRGLNAVIRMNYIPPSYRQDPANFSSRPKDETGTGAYTRFKDLIKGAVARFGGRLHYVEIWNEPNLAGEWNEAPSPSEFVKVMMAGYDGVKEADPTAQVVFPGLAPTEGTSDQKNINNITFLDACYKSTFLCPRDGKRFKDHFDILGNHSYGGNHPPTYQSSKYSPRGYQFEYNVMVNNGDSIKRILITECGYALGNQDDPSYPAITEQTRADYMAYAFREIWAKDVRVLGAMPYFLHASERVSERSFFWVQDNGTHTLQFDAVKALVPLLRDTPGKIANYTNNFLTPGRAVVDVRDAVRAMQVASGVVSVPANQVMSGDVAPEGAPDGIITTADAVRILRFAGGLASTQ